MKDQDLSWKTINEMINAMFSHDLTYPDLTQATQQVKFYGNHGVCLFKYFVSADDPQRIFVGSVLCVDFICFVLIMISYILISVVSTRSSKSAASQQRAKRNRKMNTKISVIILTDFLCWVPFCVLCLLHSLDVTDGSAWYGLFSIVILPLNSVINPLVYNNYSGKTLKSCVRALRCKRDGTLERA